MNMTNKPRQIVQSYLPDQYHVAGANRHGHGKVVADRGQKGLDQETEMFFRSARGKKGLPGDVDPEQILPLRTTVPGKADIFDDPIRRNLEHGFKKFPLTASGIQQRTHLTRGYLSGQRLGQRA